MIPVITAFESSPDRGQGFARDMRVRWALEEVGRPYEVRLVSFKTMKESAHHALNPVFRRFLAPLLKQLRRSSTKPFDQPLTSI